MAQALIVADPKIMMGKPTVAGTRITVELIPEKLAAGETVDQILAAHPRLTDESVRAAIAFAAQVLGAEVVYPMEYVQAVKIVADENVDKEIVDRLRADGHDVLFIAEDDPGIDDQTVPGSKSTDKRCSFDRRQRFWRSRFSPAPVALRSLACPTRRCQAGHEGRVSRGHL